MGKGGELYAAERISNNRRQLSSVHTSEERSVDQQTKNEDYRQDRKIKWSWTIYLLATTAIMGIAGGIWYRKVDR